MRSGLSSVALSLAILATAPLARGDATIAVALAALETRLDATPSDPALWQRRAELERRRNDFERASRDLERAGELGLPLATLERDRGILLVAKNQPQEAALALARARRLAPTDVTVLLAEARTLATLGRFRESADTYTELLRLAPTANPDVQLERARALEGIGPSADAEALSVLDEALARLGPVPALEQAALALELRSGRTDAALARLDRMAESTPRPERFLMQRAGILERAGRTDEAATAYGAALAAMETLSPQRRATPAAAELVRHAQAGIARIAARTQGAGR